MDTLAGYIDIDRRFSKLDASARPEHSALNSYLTSSLRLSDGLGWNELLKEKLVVILGEPGSGKSSELNHRCAAIRAKGEYAFFVELERLVRGAFNDVLSPEDQSLFQQWRMSDLAACFFLDSVDEAKIDRQSDFRTAIDKLQHAIGPAALERARVFISSRISEWRPETDRQEVLSRFGVFRPQEQRAQTSGTSESDAPSATLLVVQIEPLDRERVRQFVEHYGLAKPDEVVTALDEHSAWEFAGRPLDVLGLAEFWVTKGQLGSLTEIIENDISQKLKETIQRLNTNMLSETQARCGAMALAAATILCKQQQFKVPDDSFIAPNALSAVSCLPPEWRPEEINALLTRALFDSATYGRIRFHHRRIAEYLAAQWLTARITEGCPIRALDQMLFADSDGQRVLRRSLAPIAAWLCCGTESWNQDIRKWVLEAAPEIHLEYGDAMALPLEYRRSLLTEWVVRNSERERVWVRSSPDALRRLSDTRLAGEISGLLVDRTASVDMRNELVQLVRFGRLDVCLPVLLTIISSADEDDRLKRSSLAAIRDIGTPGNWQQLFEIIRQFPTLSDGLCALACETLYPSTIGPQEMVMLLRKTNDESDGSNDLRWIIERHLEFSIRPEQSGALLAELNELVQSAPHILFSGKETQVSEHFEWVLDIIPVVLAKLLSNQSLTQIECSYAVESLALIGRSRHFHFRHDDRVDSLDAATHKHPSVRRAYFWQSVEQWRIKYPSAVLYLHSSFDFGSVLQLAQTDIAWLIQDVESAAQHADKEIALRIALQLSPLEKQNARNTHRLRQAIGANTALAGLLRKFLSESRWRWFHRLRYRLRDARGWRNWWYSVCRESSRKWDRVWYQWNLYRHLCSLRAGKAIGLLAKLCTEAEESGHRCAPTNWDSLIAKRGNRITRAVKDGCKQSWRGYMPKLPHEKPIPNEMNARVIVGLAGLQAAVNDNEFPFETIRNEDVRLAIRYAVNEMNGIPTWLPTLASKRPEVVADALNACVLGEWEYPAERQHVNDVLADLSWEGGPLARLVLPTVLEKLSQGDPRHLAILTFALSLSLKVGTLPHAELTQLAIARCLHAPVTSRLRSPTSGTARSKRPIARFSAKGVREWHFPKQCATGGTI